VVGHFLLHRKMNLTKNFRLEELLRSQSATRLGIDEQFSPPDTVRDNLILLCQNVLEPVREIIEQPIHVSSGYRCPRLNELIGGARGSQHCKGQAADIECNLSAEQLYQIIKNSDIKYDQLIQEFGAWVHVSFSPFQQRGERLRAIKVDGRVKYISD